MTNFKATAARMLLASLLIAGVFPLSALAQWDPYPWKNMPRTADGKVDMNAPPRKSADGHIDLNGFWMPADNVRHLLSLASDMTVKLTPRTAGTTPKLTSRFSTSMCGFGAI